MAPVRFVVADGRDNVATAVTPIAKGEAVSAGTRDGREALTVDDDIPLGHKFALRLIERGGIVVKYGETIGVASAPIALGEHVHVHNVEGLRGRGDRP
ncbi:MAG: UxaA family hydrolase [Thermoleophilia bacterium]|nr:UxaA family hydrolase [Thermoleophilia bacterium]